MARVKHISSKSKHSTNEKTEPEKLEVTEKAEFKKKKPKHRTGTVALREIKRYQNSVDVISQKAPFSRLIREVGLQMANEMGVDPMRWTKSAIMTVQKIAEHELTKIFEKSNHLAHFAGRTTVFPRDMIMTLRMDSAYDKLIEDYLDKLSNE